MTKTYSEAYSSRTRWITCDNCGEKRDTSSKYTSPLNHQLDWIEWDSIHVVGACSSD